MPFVCKKIRVKFEVEGLLKMALCFEKSIDKKRTTYYNQNVVIFYNKNETFQKT